MKGNESLRSGSLKREAIVPKESDENSQLIVLVLDAT